MLNEQNSENNENSPAAESFTQIIEQSKASLSAETQSQGKRGRGRPKGSPNVKGREPIKDSNSNVSKEANDENPTLSAGRAEVLPPLDLQPVLKDATKLPFAIAAIKYRMPELEISDEEAATPTFYLNKVLNYYMPDLEQRNPKAFAMSAWVVSLILIGIKKVVAVIENKKNNLKTVNQSAAPNGENSNDSNNQLVPVPAQATQGPGTGSFSAFGGKF